MKIVKILGGLGNQMFQYAFLMALRNRFSDVYADISGYNTYQLHSGLQLSNVFGIELRIIPPEISRRLADEERDILSRLRRKFLGVKKTYYLETTPSSFDPSVLCSNHDMYLWGYWQNPKYFQGVESDVRKAFNFNVKESEQDQRVLDKILSRNSVAIHVRRGDYINHPELMDLSGSKYYKESISYIRTVVDNPLFFVFSNDPIWCKSTFNDKDMVFVEHNAGLRSYMDMYLMSWCSHVIIANSTFSWWSAWLREGENKIVIAPREWFRSEINFEINNLIPSEWKLI